MNITVLSGPPITANIPPQGGDLLLSWTGGIPPYQVQVTTNSLAVAWQDFGSATSSTSLLITPTNNAAFYRIVGQ
jgi:hypothetical protein